MSRIVETDSNQSNDAIALDGFRQVTIRPFLPQDGPMQRDFFSALSNECRYLRFMSPVMTVPDRVLDALSPVDHRTHAALIATMVMDGKEIMVAEARYMVGATYPARCEFAVSIANGVRRKGLGLRLLSALERQAVNTGMNRIFADTFAHNHAMLALAQRSGFAISRSPSDITRMRMTKVLAAGGQAWRAAA